MNRPLVDKVIITGIFTFHQASSNVLGRIYLQESRVKSYIDDQPKALGLTSP